MTDLKKGKEAKRVAAFGRIREGKSARKAFATTQAHLRSAAVEAFDDEGLDEAIEKAMKEGLEPRLLLIDRLINGTRIRREV